MAFTEKKYVDLTGLETFTNSLKTTLSANTASKWAVNYANTAGSATKATQDGSGNIIVDTYLTQASAKTTYVPLTRTIAGLALSTDITAESLRGAINVADGAQVNVIESVSIKGGATQTITGKNVELNLDAYAKKDDITAVLKFMGVKTSTSQLPTASANMVGHVWVVTSGTGSDAYAEYVCVDNGESVETQYTWERLGNGASLDGYYNKEEIDNKFTLLSLSNPGADGKFISAVSQTNGQVAASATAFASSVAENGKVAPTSGAVYTAIEGAKSALMGTGAGDSTSTIKKNEAAIAVLNGANTVEGSVAKSIKDAIDALDGTQGAGDYVTSVTQIDGKVSVTRATKGVVNGTDTGLVDGKTVQAALTTQIASAIAGLDVAEVGGDGKFLSAIYETDGKIFATVKPLDTTIGDNPSTVVAPTTKAVKDYADSVYTAFGSVADSDIQALFK
jgi:hypothetical protein